MLADGISQSALITALIVLAIFVLVLFIVGRFRP